MAVRVVEVEEEEVLEEEVVAADGPDWPDKISCCCNCCHTNKQTKK